MPDVGGNDRMKELRALCSAEIWSMDLSKVQEAPRRFEAGFYASEGYRSVDALRHSGFELKQLGTMARVVWFGPFARKYVEDPVHGCPFLTSSTMMEARPRREKLVSRRHTGHLEALKVYDGMILISCSGTIGNVVLCTKDVDGWACSQDAIRVAATDPDDLGPVYCFLQSPLGQFLLKKSQTGSVVRHIYEDDVSVLPVPRLPRALRAELTGLVNEASRKRVEANRLLHSADEMVYRQNYLERPQPPDTAALQAFSASFASVRERQTVEGYWRLDTKYHLPGDVIVRTRIGRNSRSRALSDVAEILLIGKTFVPGVNKVEREYGTPYFTGKELFSARITPRTWITSRNRRDIDKLLVRRGTTLVTCAGTAGRVAYAGGLLDGTTVTHDAMRVTPKPGISGGYLYAFLSSDLGAAQLRRASYGSVHSRLHDTQLAKFLVPLPDDNGEAIGSLVEEASKLQTEATEAENQCIELFLSAVRQGRGIVESEWGKQY